jgi:hypothetical protein
MNVFPREGYDFSSAAQSLSPVYPELRGVTDADEAPAALQLVEEECVLQRASSLDRRFGWRIGDLSVERKIVA